MSSKATSAATPNVRAPAYAAVAVLAGLIIDQLSKQYVFELLGLGEELTLAPVLSLRTSLNPGVAFGLAEGAAPWQLVAVGIGLSLWLAALAWRARSKLVASTLGAAIGGALGNVLDRLRFGAVRDFIDAHWQTHHWPTFNMADMFVVCGLLLFIPISGRRSKDREDHS